MRAKDWLQADGLQYEDCRSEAPQEMCKPDQGDEKKRENLNERQTELVLCTEMKQEVIGKRREEERATGRKEKGV